MKSHFHMNQLLNQIKALCIATGFIGLTLVLLSSCSRNFGVSSSEGVAKVISGASPSDSTAANDGPPGSVAADPSKVPASTPVVDCKPTGTEPKAPKNYNKKCHNGKMFGMSIARANTLIVRRGGMSLRSSQEPDGQNRVHSSDDIEGDREHKFAEHEDEDCDDEDKVVGKGDDDNDEDSDKDDDHNSMRRESFASLSSMDFEENEEERENEEHESEHHEHEAPKVHLPPTGQCKQLCQTSQNKMGHYDVLVKDRTSASMIVYKCRK